MAQNEPFKISLNKLIEDSKKLADKVKAVFPISELDGVFGIPAGGLLPGFLVAQELNLPVLEESQITPNTLIVDDLIDSGRTMNSYHEKGHRYFAIVYTKKPIYQVEQNDKFNIVIYEQVPDAWILLPHEHGTSGIDDHITRIIEYIGEDANREGLRETPKRVAKSYDRLFGGYKQKVEDILTFFQTEGYSQMVCLSNVEFYSTCEHHLLPFFGQAFIAYVPALKIVGISKLARVLEIFSRRLQNQERLTEQIAVALEEYLQPRGIAVVLKGQHFCMMARGVEKQNSIMTTSKMTGVFLDEKNIARMEFLNLIK